MNVWKSRCLGSAILIFVLSASPAPADGVDSLSRLRVEGHRIVSTNAAAADFDVDGRVDLPDFLLFADAFGSTRVEFDLDNSGTVDFVDFLAFADAFGQRFEFGFPAKKLVVFNPVDGCFFERHELPQQNCCKRFCWETRAFQPSIQNGVGYRPKSNPVAALQGQSLPRGQRTSAPW